MKELIELLMRYVDAKVEYEIVSHQEDSEGYRESAVREEKEVERIIKEIEQFKTK